MRNISCPIICLICDSRGRQFGSVVASAGVRNLCFDALRSSETMKHR